MPQDIKTRWFDEFLGVAYRYFDIRMNIVLMFSERKPAANLWIETIKWWNDHTIKIRFVESGDDYWFVMAAESRKANTNMNFFKVLPKSENYERFKKGHDGSAFLRFGIYSKKGFDEVKKDQKCECEHEKEDHEEEGDNICMIEGCSCKKFESYQVILLKTIRELKKTVVDIKFMTEDEVKDDPLTWNCLNRHQYSEQ